MIVVVDREYRVALANRAFLEYLSVTADQLIGHPVTEVLDRDVFETVIKKKLEECFSGNYVHYELKYRFPALGERDLLVSYAPLEISGGITGAACVIQDLTEQRRMERAETDWQKRIELAQQSGLGIGLWDWDLQANTVIWSDETCRQWGYSPGEFSGRVEDAVQRIHPEDRPGVEAAIGRVLSGQSTHYAAQYRIVRPDGSICWVDTRGVVVRDGSEHMLGVAIDITELKRIQQSLQESEEKYLLLLNSTAEAIFGIDVYERCSFCNPATLRLLGYAKPEELLGQNMHRVMHHTRSDGSSFPDEECPIHAAVREGRTTHMPGELFWRADGSSFVAECWSWPMYKDGKLVGAVVTFLDITERIRAEEARRRSDARYRELFENATYGIFTSREDGTLLDVNSAMVSMLGYGSKTELLAQNLDRDIYQDAASRAAILSQLPSNGQVYSADAVWKRKDKKTITVHLSGRIVWGEDRSMKYMEVFAEDITERLSLEAQFHQAQKMEAIGQLAGGVAHDFNNLLTVINGYTEMLLNRLKSDDPDRELVEPIREAGLRSAALTKQLLVFSRKQVVALRPIDLNAVIANLHAMLRRIIGEDIDLTIHLCVGPCIARADAGRVEQVIMNLAVNARDAMPQGGRLTIRTAKVQVNEENGARPSGILPGNYVLVTVSDTGTGMSEEVKSHIFEPFYTTKDPEKGTGLGLAVVHGIVKSWNGHIEVESCMGEGTTFRIYLPAGEKPGPSSPAPDKLQRARAGTRETILLVEDNQPLRALLCRILKDHGYVLLDAAEGAEALRLAEQHTEPIAVLATDIVLPGVGGKQLAEQIHSIHPETRVLYLSGYADDAVARHGILNEGIDFLEKPFAPEALIIKIREILDRN
jgi:two-component system NtrC family sensor kinase